MKNFNQITACVFTIATLVIMTNIVGCSSHSGKKEVNNSTDSTNFSIIDKIIGKDSISFKDYETLFSGKVPLVFSVLDDYNATHSDLSKIKILCIEKLRNKVIELSNGIPNSKVTKKNIDQIMSWPIIWEAGETYTKWHKGLEQIENSLGH